MKLKLPWFNWRVNVKDRVFNIFYGIDFIWKWL